MPQIRRIALLTLLAAVLVAAPSFGQTVLAGATPGGAFYTIAVPDAWNGGLVIYNHGFTLTPGTPGPDLGPLLEGLTNLLWGAEAVPPKPSIAERILPIVESAGVEPALARYRDWKRTRPDQYEYGPSELMTLARHFYDGGDTGVAIEIDAPTGP